MLTAINCFLPKNKKWVFFYESVDCELHDNSRALYNYMKKHYPEYKYFICASNKEKNRKLFSNHTVVVGQLKGILYFMLSKYCFYSYSSLRIKPSSKQVIVNMWHGTPLKVIGNLSKDKFNTGEDMCSFTYLLAASEFFKPIMREAFGCKESQVLVCGHPRTDDFFVETHNDYLDEIKRHKKSIIWMPTFRVTKDARHKDLGDNYKYDSETMLPLLETYSSLNTLDDFCVKNDILLIIKAHTLAQINNVDFHNIHMIKDEDLEKRNISLYQFIAAFDALITDYSSIYFDYLLLNKPMCFIINDIELYQSARGFVVDNPCELRPGNHIKTIAEFYQFLSQILSGIDLYYLERRRVNDLCNQYHDGDNSKRLLQLIGM